MFRDTQMRLNMLSEESTNGQGTGASILKVDIDALDQAKTRYPRNMVNAKSLSGVWRPTAHVICAIVHGDPWFQICIDSVVRLDSEYYWSYL